MKLEQKKRHRYKYPILVKLTNKLCGFTQSNKATRWNFLKKIFPGSYKLTWGRLLNPLNRKTLETDIKKQKLKRRMYDLLMKFTEGNVLKFLAEQKPQLCLKSYEMKRLMRLSNALEDEMRSNEKTSRDLIHMFTNILACIVSPGKGKSSVNCKDLHSAGWKFTRFSALGGSLFF